MHTSICRAMVHCANLFPLRLCSTRVSPHEGWEQSGRTWCNRNTPESFRNVLQSHSDFHGDLFPDTAGELPAMTAQQWFDGANDKASLDTEEQNTKVPQTHCLQTYCLHCLSWALPYSAKLSQYKLFFMDQAQRRSSWCVSIGTIT